MIGEYVEARRRDQPGESPQEGLCFEDEVRLLGRARSPQFEPHPSVGEAHDLLRRERANWGDIEDAKPLRRLVFHQQWSTKDRVMVSRTKEGARKLVPVHPDFEAYLAEARRWFEARTGRELGEADPLCPFLAVNTVKRWDARTALRRWKRHLRQLGVTSDGSAIFHQTRHTLCSGLINCGASPLSAQAITHAGSAGKGSAHLGYVHLSWEALCEAMMCLKVPGVAP